MNSDLRYDIWDILKAPRLALSGKNLLVQARAILCGYVFYLILTYLALLIDGVNLGYAWRTYSIFPFSRLDFYNWYATAIWIIGLFFFVSFIYYGCLTVSKLVFEELKGNFFFPVKKARKTACTLLQKFWVVIILLALLAIVLAVFQAVVGLVGLIPVVGEIIYSILYVFPLILWSLFIIFLVFGLFTSFLTLPAILVTTENDTFGASFYIYNTFWTQPLRWLSMSVISLVLAKISMFVLGYFLMRSLQLTNYTASIFASEKTTNILTAAYNMFVEQSKGIEFFTSLYPGSSISFNWIEFNSYYNPAGSEYIASLIIFIGLVLIGIVIISYGLNIITCGQLLTSLLVRYQEDNEKLTEDLQVREIDPHEIVPPETATDEDSNQ